MNRRAFLRFLPGAIVGGKQAAKAAVDAATEKLVFEGIEGTVAGPVPAPHGVPMASSTGEYARKELLRLANPFYVDQRREDDSWVNRLDPDLASMHSMSLSARISIQRDRNVGRAMDRHKRWLSRALTGAFDD